MPWEAADCLTRDYPTISHLLKYMQRTASEVDDWANDLDKKTHRSAMEWDIWGPSGKRVLVAKLPDKEG